jgi:hypothetical protein
VLYRPTVVAFNVELNLRRDSRSKAKGQFQPGGTGTIFIAVFLVERLRSILGFRIDP